jgi:hypothetical protein
MIEGQEEGQEEAGEEGEEGAVVLFCFVVFLSCLRMAQAVYGIETEPVSYLVALSFFFVSFFLVCLSLPPPPFSFTISILGGNSHPIFTRLHFSR